MKEEYEKRNFLGNILSRYLTRLSQWALEIREKGKIYWSVLLLGERNFQMM